MATIQPPVAYATSMGSVPVPVPPQRRRPPDSASSNSLVFGGYLASLESAWKVGEASSDGGDGSRVSAYEGKYWQP